MSQSGGLYNVVHSIHGIYYVTLYNFVQLCTTMHIVTFLQSMAVLGMRINRLGVIVHRTVTVLRNYIVL